MGVSADGEAVVVIECRRYPKSSLKQSDMAALAWTINDFSASGGLVVTPIGVQKGGQLPRGESCSRSRGTGPRGCKRHNLTRRPAPTGQRQAG